MGPLHGNNWIKIVCLFVDYLHLLVAFACFFGLFVCFYVCWVVCWSVGWLVGLFYCFLFELLVLLSVALIPVLVIQSDPCDTALHCGVRPSETAKVGAMQKGSVAL